MKMPKNQLTGRKCIKVNATSFAQLIKHLAHGDLTCEELAIETGLHKLTVYHYCRALHDAGVVYISRFEPDTRGRHNIKVYCLGAGKDAKRPKMTAVERQARHRAKIDAQRMNMVLAGRAEYVMRANGGRLFQMLGASA